MSGLNVEVLASAIAALEEGLREYKMYPLLTMRDGVIQRFEVAMDLSWKLLQRTLKSFNINMEQMRTKNDLFRMAAEYRLIADAERWIEHYAARNQTSHRYDGSAANEVFAHVSEFLPDAYDLLARLKRDA
ncbi:MAG: nucleotidyltransferase substrate binding protein [Magnetococcales bacterium]|nr:nucleotidyltransferase substrate binding protein [Magnetococcales bacterium]